MNICPQNNLPNPRIGWRIGELAKNLNRDPLWRRKARIGASDFRFANSKNAGELAKWGRSLPHTDLPDLAADELSFRSTARRRADARPRRLLASRPRVSRRPGASPRLRRLAGGARRRRPPGGVHPPAVRAGAAAPRLRR